MALSMIQLNVEKHPKFLHKYSCYLLNKTHDYKNCFIQEREETKDDNTVARQTLTFSY